MEVDKYEIWQKKIDKLEIATEYTNNESTANQRNKND